MYFTVMIINTAMLLMGNVYLIVGLQFHDLNLWLRKRWNTQDLEIISKNYSRLFRVFQTLDYIYGCSISLVLFLAICEMVPQAFLTFERRSLYETHLSTLGEIVTTIYRIFYQFSYGLIRFILFGYLIKIINYGEYHVSIISVQVRMKRN